MILTATRIEDLVIQLDKEIHVRASLETTFDAMLTQLGPGNTTPDGTPMAAQNRTVAWWPLVSRSRQQQWPPLGPRPGHQAPDAARSLRPADDIFPGDPQRSVPSKRSGRRHAPHVSSLRVRRPARPRRLQKRHKRRLDAHLREHPQTGRIPGHAPLKVHVMPSSNHKSPRTCSWVPHPQILEGAGFPTVLGAIHRNTPCEMSKIGTSFVVLTEGSPEPCALLASHPRRSSSQPLCPPAPSAPSHSNSSNSTIAIWSNDQNKKEK